jgi:hypothetical protein
MIQFFGMAPIRSSGDECIYIECLQWLATPSHPIYMCSLAPLEISSTLVFTTHMEGLWEGFEGIQVKLTWWRVCLVCIYEFLAWITISEG